MKSIIRMINTNGLKTVGLKEAVENTEWLRMPM